MADTDKRPDPDRAEKIRQAFIAFGAAIGRSRQIEMVTCPTCEQLHVLDVRKEILRAAERVKRAESSGR